MINFNFNDKCCGCMACANICGNGAITMIQNQEGFFMPKVNDELCIKCGSCINVCPFLNHSSKSDIELLNSDFYLFYSNDDEARMRSASGGAFFTMAKAVIEGGGYVCGCIWDDDMKAVHIVSNDINDVIRMQSSKYTQSEIGDCYKKTLALLNEGKKVIFSGTPCQISALKNFIGTDYPKLICTSVVCHGVPSPEVWKKYKVALEKKYGAKLKNVDMRSKVKYGYPKTSCRYEFENGKIVEWETYLYDKYCFAFTDNLYIRNSCTDCVYKGDRFLADIIMGDFHKNISGSRKYGVSFIVCTGDKGRDFVNRYLKYNLEKFNDRGYVMSNDMLWNSVKPNKNREAFFSLYNDTDIIKCINKFLPMRFRLKVLLNKVGLFYFIKGLKQWWRKN